VSPKNGKKFKKLKKTNTNAVQAGVRFAWNYELINMTHGQCFLSSDSLNFTFADVLLGSAALYLQPVIKKEPPWLTARTTRVSNSLCDPGFSAIKVSLKGKIKLTQILKEGYLHFLVFRFFSKHFIAQKTIPPSKKKTRPQRLIKKSKDLRLNFVCSTMWIFARNLYQVNLQNVRPPCFTETSGT